MILDRLFGKAGGSRILTSGDLAQYHAGRTQSGSGVNDTDERALQLAAFDARLPFELTAGQAEVGAGVGVVAVTGWRPGRSRGSRRS